MLAKYYLKQQYQLSINDMYKLKKERKCVSLHLVAVARQTSSANRVVYAKEDFFAAGHVSHQLN